MGQSNAERQRAFRQRHLKDEAGERERLNVLIDLSAKRRLERLASCYGVTQRAVLEKLLADAEREVLGRLPAEAQGDYYDQRLKLDVTP